MRQTFAIALLLLCAACHSNPTPNRFVLASQEFTVLYTGRTPWKVRGVAAGSDCSVLLVNVDTSLNDTAVEAIQYGAPEYGSEDGGVRGFAEYHRFRAVTYRDAHGALWTFGATTLDEARALRACE